MSLATALLTPILGDASPWTPRRLFQLGEAGGVYDPSDLTAEKVAWRRNLLAWSEDFTNAAWTKGAGSTIVANAAVAPDGTTTADKLRSGTALGEYRVTQAIALTSGTPVVFSGYAKRDEWRYAFVYGTGTAVPSATGIVDLDTGAVTLTPSSGTLAVTAVGNGWYRIQWTFTPVASASDSVRFGASNLSNSPTTTGDGTSGIFIWGAQFELGSTATAYQRITDFTSDFLAAFPTHGLYQDAAGTTPVTALGQPVGLVIDSKTGGLANVGPELIAGGDFESGLIGSKTDGSGSVSTWTINTSAPISGTQDGRFVISTASASARPILNFGGTTVSGRMYQYSFNYKVNSGSPIISLINNAGALLTYNAVLAGTGTFRTYIVATGTTNFGALYFGNATCDVQFDNISVREVPGVHAIQPTNSSRPLLDGRVNLLTFSEQFDGAWTKTSGATVTANSTTAPNGTTTAYTLTAPTGGATRGVRRVSAGLVANATFVWSTYAKRSTSDWIYLVSYDVGAGVGAWFNVNTGQVGTVQSGVTASIESVGNGWYRCSVVRPVGASVAFNEIDIMLANADNTTTSSTGNAVFIWGADLRLAADAAYPYQRVAAATDYADVGVPRAFAFDGFDDSLYTASNMDLSGTDKVTVLAGVRKLSDAARGMLMEHSSAYSNAGTFGIDAPTSVGPNYFVAANGTTLGGYFLTTFAAPVTNVISALFNLAGATLPAQIIPRVNGLTPTLGATGSTGVNGNFSSQVFYIGRRGNTSLPFNGKVYQLIVRGALTDAATLAQAERYVGAKTGLYI